MRSPGGIPGALPLAPGPGRVRHLPGPGSERPTPNPVGSLVLVVPVALPAHRLTRFLRSAAPPLSYRVHVSRPVRPVVLMPAGLDPSAAAAAWCAALAAHLREGLPTKQQAAPAGTRNGLYHRNSGQGSVSGCVGKSAVR
jgi:hypothetical protein